MPGKFRTQFEVYEQPVRIYQEPGDRVKTVYSPFYDDFGVMQLRPTGKHDLYAEIQSHAESVDIHVLMERYQQGDAGVLARVQGAYGDFTQLPSTFAEALNLMTAAEQYFLGLPVETRALFGHDFRQFIASMDQPDWTKKVGIDLPGASDLSPETAPPPASPAAPPPASPAGE